MNKQVQDLLLQLTRDYTPEMLKELQDGLETINYYGGLEIRSLEDLMIEKRFTSEDDGEIKVYCPLCGCYEVVKNGHAIKKDKNGNGTYKEQRYKCKGCGHTFQGITNSIFSSAKMTINDIRKMIKCIIDGISVREGRKVTGKNKNSVFLWRCKLGDCARGAEKTKTMTEYVEADETFMEVSYKGASGKDKDFVIPRTITYIDEDGNTVTKQRVYHRGAASQKANDKKKGIKSKRGLSTDKVCIACATDKKHNGYGIPVSRGGCSADALTYGLKDHIQERTRLCTDGKKEYEKLADLKRLDLRKFVNKRCDNYGNGIQRINNYHSELKKWLDRYMGMSTKWLPNYISLFNLFQYSKEKPNRQADVLMDFAFKQARGSTRKKQPRRAPVPLAGMPFVTA